MAVGDNTLGEAAISTLPTEALGTGTASPLSTLLGDSTWLAAASDFQVLRRSGTSLSFGQVSIDQASAITGTLPVGNGGTGLASFTAGDLLYATGTTTLTKLAKGTAFQILEMNSGATAPQWGSTSRGFMGSRAASFQTWTAGAATTMTFDTEDYDDDTAFVHTTGTFTCQVAGLYFFCAVANIPLAVGESAEMQFFKNGSLFMCGPDCAYDNTSSSCAGHSVIMKLAVNDTVTARVFNGDTVGRVQAGGVHFNYFTGCRIR